MENDGKDYDRKELLKELVSDFAQKEKDKLLRKEKESQQQKTSDVRRTCFRVIGAGIAGFLFLRLLVVVSGEGYFFQKAHYWAMGERSADDPEADECIRRLWMVRKAVDGYYARYKEFPADMDVLGEAGFLKNKPVCPSSQAEYIFVDWPARRVFCCPSPEKHGMKQLWCDVKEGPPIIERGQAS